MTYSQYNMISVLIRQYPYSNTHLTIYARLGLPVSRRFVELPVEACISEVTEAQEQ